MAFRLKKKKFRWVEEIILWPIPGTAPAVILEVLRRFTSMTTRQIVLVSGLHASTVSAALTKLKEEAFITSKVDIEDRHIWRYELGPAALWWLRRAAWSKETKKTFRAVNHEQGSGTEGATGKADGALQ